MPVADDSGSSERAVPLSADVYADPGDGTEGGLVAFFAAQSTETTPERGYEVTGPDGSTIKQNYGVFTYTIFSALAKNPNMTYRQLAQSVLSNYAAENSLKPTPLFEGQLDAPVFGNEDAADVAQWPTVERRRRVAQHFGRRTARPRQGQQAAAAAQSGRRQ